MDAAIQQFASGLGILAGVWLLMKLGETPGRALSMAAGGQVLVLVYKLVVNS